MVTTYQVTVKTAPYRSDRRNGRRMRRGEVGRREKSKLLTVSTLVESRTAVVFQWGLDLCLQNGAFWLLESCTVYDCHTDCSDWMMRAGILCMYQMWVLERSSPDLVVIKKWALMMSLDIIVACNYLSDTCVMWTRALETRLASYVVHLLGSCQMTGPFFSVGSGRMSWSKYSYWMMSLQLTLAIVCAGGSWQTCVYDQ